MAQEVLSVLKGHARRPQAPTTIGVAKVVNPNVPEALLRLPAELLRIPSRSPPPGTLEVSFTLSVKRFQLVVTVSSGMALS